MESIKVGDKLIQYNHGFASRLFTVTKVTKTQVTAVADDRPEYAVRLYDKCGTLKEVGSDRFNRASYKHATPEMLAAYNEGRKRAELIEKLKAANWQRYTTESLENICKLINNLTPEQ